MGSCSPRPLTPCNNRWSPWLPGRGSSEAPAAMPGAESPSEPPQLSASWPWSQSHHKTWDGVCSPFSSCPMEAASSILFSSSLREHQAKAILMTYLLIGALQRASCLKHSLIELCSWFPALPGLCVQPASSRSLHLLHGRRPFLQ